MPARGVRFVAETRGGGDGGNGGGGGGAAVAVVVIKVKEHNARYVNSPVGSTNWRFYLYFEQKCNDGDS